MDKLLLEIVTPDGMIYSQNVSSVTLPGEDGEFGVLPKHSPLFAMLTVGIIEIIENQEQDKEPAMVAINWGYANVDEKKVTVLADGAVYIGGNNDSAIAKSINQAKELINSIRSDNLMLLSTQAKIDKLVK